MDILRTIVSPTAASVTSKNWELTSAGIGVSGPPARRPVKPTPPGGPAKPAGGAEPVPCRRLAGFQGVQPRPAKVRNRRPTFRRLKVMQQYIAAGSRRFRPAEEHCAPSLSRKRLRTEKEIRSKGGCNSGPGLRPNESSPNPAALKSKRNRDHSILSKCPSRRLRSALANPVAAPASRRRGRSRPVWPTTTKQ